jgi:hypothetical protein
MRGAGRRWLRGLVAAVALLPASGRPEEVAAVSSRERPHYNPLQGDHVVGGWRAARPL